MTNKTFKSTTDAIQQKSKERSIKFGLIRDLFVFWFVIFLAVLCWKNNILVTAILVAAFWVRYYFWPDKEDLVLYIGGAILGPIAEIIATKAGIWQYTLPTFFNIPLWLPFAWGFAAVLIIRIALAFVRK